MCMCNFDGDKIILIEIRPFKLSHFMQLLTLLGMGIVKSTSPPVFNRSFSDLAYILWLQCKCLCGALMAKKLILTELRLFELSHFRQL